MLRFALFGACGLAVAWPAFAEPQPIAGHAIRETFAGSSIRLDTPLAATVPIHYAINGQVTGEAGNLSWVLGSATDTGRWWVEKDRLCHKWTTWFEAENQCLRLRQEGDRLFWVRDDGKTGTATFATRPLQAPVQSQSYASIVPPPAASPKVQVPPSKAGLPVAPRAVAAPPPAIKPAPVQVASLPPAPAPKPQAAPPKRSPTASSPPIVTPSKPPATVSPVAVVPTFMVAGVEEDDVLYVRDGPSADHASIGALSPQAQGVKIQGTCQQEWCPVVHKSIKGWVNTYYLVAETPARSPPLALNRATERR